MIGLDTNVLVRFLVQDEPVQARAAAEIMGGLTEASPGFISREVLLEVFRVLRAAYGLDRETLCDAVEGLATSIEIVVEDAGDALAAAAIARAGEADFADAMIVAAARRAGCEALVTFDRKAARLDGARLAVEARA